MAQFRFTYEVVETWTGYFEADTEEQAQKLYDAMVENDENPEEVLPKYEERNFDICRSHEGFGFEKISD